MANIPAYDKKTPMSAALPQSKYKAVKKEARRQHVSISRVVEMAVDLYMAKVSNENRV